MSDGEALTDFDLGVRLGWFEAASAGYLCGAYNFHRPPPSFALCRRRNDHTGKHDDGWDLWGNPAAPREQNVGDARLAASHLRPPRRSS